MKVADIAKGKRNDVWRKKDMGNDRIDSHKLIFHPVRVAEWIKTEGGGIRLMQK